MRIGKNKFMVILLCVTMMSGCAVKSSKTIDKLEGNASVNQEKIKGTENPIKVSEGDGSLKKDWKLVWGDEFNSDEIDKNLWGYELGYIRNKELQYYTDRLDNARVEDGNLVIEAKKEDMNGYKYTSASLNTKGKMSWKYGKIEMRAKLPYGKGIWPAFWTMGDTNKWPACGEIDIMELIGGGKGYDNKAYGTLHWDNEGHDKIGSSVLLPIDNFCDDYHIFSIEWDETKIVWFLDGKDYLKIDITKPWMTEFHQNHYVLLNLAVGGSWPGSPNDATVFPQKYLVDWVRIYQR